MSVPKITPKTATDTARFLLQAGQVPARLSAPGLTGAEVVALKIVDGYGGAEVVGPMYRDGVALTLKPTEPAIGIYVPGWYEVTKPVTAANVGVYLYCEAQ